jgi:hypothetical protein
MLKFFVIVTVPFRLNQMLMSHAFSPLLIASRRLTLLANLTLTGKKSTRDRHSSLLYFTGEEKYHNIETGPRGESSRMRLKVGSNFLTKIFFVSTHACWKQIHSFIFWHPAPKSYVFLPFYDSIPWPYSKHLHGIPCWRGRISTVDLLLPTNWDWLLLILILFSQ